MKSLNQIFFATLFGVVIGTCVYAQSEQVTGDPVAASDVSISIVPDIMSDPALARWASLNVQSPAPDSSGGWGGQQNVHGWHQGVLPILNRYKAKAIREMSVGRQDLAVKTLFDGLQAARSPRGPSYEGIFTTKALERAVVIGATVAEVLGKAPDANATTRHVLLEEYQFIEDDAVPLDSQYYIPYVNCGQCPERNPVADLEFQRRIVQFVQRQILVPLAGLTGQMPSSYRYGHVWEGHRVVYPIGNVEAFLKTLSLTMRYSAYDLSEELLANYFSCQIGELIELSEQIDSGAFHYPNGYQSAYFAAERLVQSIRWSPYGCPSPGQHQCGPVYPEPPHRFPQPRCPGPHPAPCQAPMTTKDITPPISNFRICSGEIERKQLTTRGNLVYLKTLYFNAIAYRRAAKLRVYVDGEPIPSGARQSIHVPAYDPAYTIVDINKWVNTVVFVHEGGGEITLSDFQATINWDYSVDGRCTKSDCQIHRFPGPFLESDPKVYQR